MVYIINKTGKVYIINIENRKSVIRIVLSFFYYIFLINICDRIAC